MGFSRQEYWNGLPCRGSFWHRYQTWVSWTASRFFTTWATREFAKHPLMMGCNHIKSVSVCLGGSMWFHISLISFTQPHNSLSQLHLLSYFTEQRETIRHRAPPLPSTRASQLTFCIFLGGCSSPIKSYSATATQPHILTIRRAPLPQWSTHSCIISQFPLGHFSSAHL